MMASEEEDDFYPALTVVLADFFTRNMVAQCEFDSSSFQ